jgi:hypothetical protein
LTDLFGVESPHRTHGQSLIPLLRGDSDSIREWALGGTFGQWVQVNDGHRKYARAPVGDGFPLSMWSNRWSTMPIRGMPGVKLPAPDRRAWLDFMPGSEVPVIRQPFEPGDWIPYWALNPSVGDHHCYAYVDDPEELNNRRGGSDEADLIELLRVALREVEAPDEQFQRLGIA